jgi:AraC-like DNA-binding protein
MAALYEACSRRVLNEIHMVAAHSHAFAPRPLTPGPIRHAPHEWIGRHRHDRGFVALVLAGRYTEAGDTGRHIVAAGDVIVHQSWESHLNEVDRCGAQVLVLPLDSSWQTTPRGTVGDADAIARLAERDAGAAIALLTEAFVDHEAAPLDWPDQLAEALRHDPNLELGAWARRHSLHPGSLGRGFTQLFGTTPAGYRRDQRMRRALMAIAQGEAKLSAVAAEAGFADQAHMTRTIGRSLGTTPSAIRRNARP